MAGLSQPSSSKVKLKKGELGKKKPSQARGIAGIKCLSKNCTFHCFVSVLLCPLFWLNWELLIIAIHSYWHHSLGWKRSFFIRFLSQLVEMAEQKICMYTITRFFFLSGFGHFVLVG